MNMEQFDVGATKYRRRAYFCRKAGCGPCREGKGHGPYWYACRVENGRSVQRYLGATLPAEALQVWEMQGGRSCSRLDAQEAGASLRLFTLGTFRVERWDGARWQTLPQTASFPSDARRLLGYVLTRPGRSTDYAQVLAALWPSHTPADARLFLRKTIRTLTRTLLTGATHTRIDAYLRIHDAQLTLAEQDQLWVDADAFAGLLEPASIQEEASEHERRLREAHTLYRGEFLAEERHSTWALAQRRALHHAWTTVTLALADRAIARLAYVEAIDVLHRLLAADPLHESAMQRLTAALTALDRRGEALRVYERFTQLLLTQPRSADLRVQQIVQYKVPDSEESAISGEVVEYERPLHRTVDRAHQYGFVGRVRELEELRALLRRVERRQSHACFVGVTGEAGMGKTRLVEQLVLEAQQQGWNSLWSRTSREECHIPYRVWTSVLQHLEEDMGWPWQEILRRPRVFAPLAKLLPTLQDGLPQMEQAQLSSEQEEMLLWEAVHELLVLLSTGRPLVVVLDDLHWADSGSCRLLVYLTRHLHGRPLLLLATCREQELRGNEHLHSLLLAHEDEDMVRTIALSPLDEGSLHTLIADHAPLPSPWVRTIAERAGGNPFFAEELTRQAMQLHERGVSSAGAEATLPVTIDALLGLRISHLSPACQRLLSKAAVLGRSFALTLIATMEGQSAGMQEEGLLDLLDEALQAGVLIEEGGGTTIMYQFWHPLLVSHLYEHLSAARRASYHRQTVQALKQSAPGDDAAMVRHLLAGGAEAGELASYAERAGDQAYLLATYPEATYYYTLTLEHLEPQTPWERVLTLAEHLGECHMIRGNYPEARAAYTRALHVLREQQPGGDADVVQRQALLWCELGWTWRYAGEVARAHECRLAAERLLDGAGIVAGPAWASTRYQQSSLYWQEGCYQEALDAAHEALVLFEQHLATSRETVARSLSARTRIECALSGDPVNLGRMLILLANILIATGKSSDAITHLKRALVLFEARQCVREVAIVHGNLGDIYLRMGQHREAQHVLQQSLEIAERIGDMPVMCVNEGNLGILANRLEETERAEALLRRAMQRAEQIDDAVYVSLWSAFLAEVLGKQGKYAEARSCLRRAFARGRGIPPCMVQALVTLCKIRIACANSATGARNALLLAAHATTQRILVTPMLEAETRVEGYVLLAQTLFLLEDGAADQIVVQALEEARRNELFWQVERLQALSRMA